MSLLRHYNTIIKFYFFHLTSIFFNLQVELKKNTKTWKKKHYSDQNEEKKKFVPRVGNLQQKKNALNGQKKINHEKEWIKTNNGKLTKSQLLTNSKNNQKNKLNENLLKKEINGKKNKKYQVKIHRIIKTVTYTYPK